MLGSVARTSVDRWHASAEVNSLEELLDALTLINWMQAPSPSHDSISGVAGVGDRGATVLLGLGCFLLCPIHDEIGSGRWFPISVWRYGVSVCILVCPISSRLDAIGHFLACNPSVRLALLALRFMPQVDPSPSTCAIAHSVPSSPHVKLSHRRGLFQRYCAVSACRYQVASSTLSQLVVAPTIS
ncbi:hypothetical protein R1flu_027916 [Riccia fluitans]|uniref:Uncharacterized protein n=1 Tax=Riccia fluitans TaxID=41844 RepID=A0ABD1XP84_9MARC